MRWYTRVNHLVKCTSTNQDSKNNREECSVKQRNLKLQAGQAWPVKNLLSIVHRMDWSGRTKLWPVAQELNAKFKNS